MGWQNIFHCEKDPFCQKILKHYWPNAETIGDIKEFNAKKYRNKIDIITGGFPCQPFSTAGERKGTADDRYLWPDMLRVIREIQPAWVVGENVYGLVSWQEGLVFEQVHLDLEAEGYQVTAFVLPAAGINAPHQRYRVWIIAHNPGVAAKRKQEADPNAEGLRWRGTRICGKAQKGPDTRGNRKPNGLYKAQLAETDPNANGEGLEGRPKFGRVETGRQKTFQQFIRLYKRGQWRNWPGQSPLCGGDDGLPTGLDGITLSKWKAQSIKMFGNAIVPQMAVCIFESINTYEQSPPPEAA